MNFYVAVTDYDWFLLHASKSRVEEVKEYNAAHRIGQ